MSLAAAAVAMGLPEVLVQRSAEARAADTGASVDEILTAWAGGETVEAPVAPEPTTEPLAIVEKPDDVDAPEPTPPPSITEPASTPSEDTVVTRVPVPTEVNAVEASRLSEVVTVPTAGIKERTNFVIPKWLAAVMLIVPLFALFALGGASTGACGEATELDTNVVTGEIVNCDGSEFTGSQIGGGGTDFIALGADIYSGVAITGVNCAGCHGVNGQGAGSFPALTGVLTTFGSCVDHLEWVTLGSPGFQSEGRDTYGDTNKTVQGGMPSFGGSLSADQIAAVAAFERVRFGGQDPESTLVDCGLVDEADGDEDATEDDANTEGGGEEDTTGAWAGRLG